MQFLIGLNDQFSVVKTQILLRDPLPSLNKVYSLVIQEERNHAPILSLPTDESNFWLILLSPRSLLVVVKDTMEIRRIHLDIAPYAIVQTTLLTLVITMDSLTLTNQEIPLLLLIDPLIMLLLNMVMEVTLSMGMVNPVSIFLRTYMSTL